jgi:mRNA interferase HigB
MMFARTPDGVRFATLEALSPTEPFSRTGRNLNANYKIQNIILVSGIFVFLRPKSSDMKIITKTTIKEYIDRNPKSRIALLDWVKKTEQAEWHNFSDIRKTFNSVDYVGNQHYVFNIKGNDYRLVVVIQFTPQHVYIRFIGTHAEYDNIKDIKNL